MTGRKLAEDDADTVARNYNAPGPNIPALSRRYSRPPFRHSRESGNPHPALSPRRGLPGFWIPACAGMTVGAVVGWMVCGLAGGWRRSTTLPHPTLSRWERVCAWRPYGVFAIINGNGELRIGAPPESPLPAGEGWVRESRCHPTTLYDARQPHRHSRPQSVIPASQSVIPAKAGIHPPPSPQPGLPGVLDSGRRRNDGGVAWQHRRWRLARFLPHPTLSRWERAFGGRPIRNS